MWTYFITYDLRKPGQDYHNLYKEIKKLGTWTHPVESVWFVRAPYTESTIRNRLSDHIDSNDILIIAELKPGMWASSNLAASTQNLLNAR